MAKHRQTFLKACLLLLALIPVSGGMRTEAAGAENAMVHVDGQHLTIQATHTPVETLLGQIARQSHIEIFLQGRADHPVTVDFDRVSLERGIKRLISGHNHAFTYGLDANSKILIKQLHVYSRTGDGIMKRMALPDVVRPAPSLNPSAEKGIVIHARTPNRRDPLVSMQAIDPLMRLNQAQASYLPEGFHQADTHDVGADGGRSPQVGTASLKSMR